MKKILILFLLPISLMAAEMPRTDFDQVGPSQTNNVLGVVGAQGDILERLIIIPQTTTVSSSVGIRDGSSTVIIIRNVGFYPNLDPIIVPVGARSASGAWSVTTGASVNVIGVGRFK